MPGRGKRGKSSRRDADALEAKLAEAGIVNGSPFAPANILGDDLSEDGDDGDVFVDMNDQQKAIVAELQQLQAEQDRLTKQLSRKVQKATERFRQDS